MSNRRFLSEHRRTVSLEKILIVLYAIYACRGAWLAFESNQYLPWFALLMITLTYICVGVAGVYLLRNPRVSRYSIVMCAVPLLYWAMQIFHPAGGYSGGWELALISIVLYLFLPDSIKAAIFRVFYWIVQGANVVSILVWVLFFAGIDIGFHRVLYYAQADQYTTYYYIRWFIFAILQSGDSYRLCGIFNEPGGLGTLCALLFICTYKKSSRWEKVLLLISGTCTFSLAFFLLIFGFITVYVCQKRLFNMLYIFLFLAVFLAIPQIDFHNDSLNKAAARFAITEDGLAGDNRTTDSFDRSYDEFLDSDDIWLGKGPTFSFGGANLSYKSHYILRYGFIGTAAMLGSWVALALYCARGRRTALLYSLFFFVSLYQRPAVIMSITGYVLLVGGNIWLTQGLPGQEKPT